MLFDCLESLLLEEFAKFSNEETVRQMHLNFLSQTWIAILDFLLDSKVSNTPGAGSNFPGLAGEDWRLSFGPISFLSYIVWHEFVGGTL